MSALLDRLTFPLQRALARALPPLSETEREALEAGTVWWEGELMTGRPRWERLLALAAPRLREDERAFLEGPVERLCAMLDDWDIHHRRHDLPPEVWDLLRRERFFGMIIPPEHGGLGFSALGHSAVVAKVASRSVAAAVTVMVPNSLGPAKLLLHYGTPAQRERYLPRLARGEEIPCFALTSPVAGSDAAAMTDRGVVCRGRWRGEEVLGIRLSWSKRYITLAPVATLIGLAFRLHDPEGLLGGEVPDGAITLALVPADAPGVRIGRRHLPLGLAFMNGPIQGEDVFVPLEAVIGGRAGVGRGWRMLMECLAEGRGISLPALSVAAAELACREVGAYARVRRQFGAPLARFEGVQEALGRMAGRTYWMDAARRFLTVGLEAGERPAVASAILKHRLTEAMRRVVADAMDVRGGSAICLGPRNRLGLVWQAVPVGITVEGANILTRSMIVFGQGAVRCHPWLLPLIRAAQAQDAEGARRFRRALAGFAGHLAGALARALWYGLGGARLVRVPCRGAAARHLRAATRLAACLAVAADLAVLTLGGGLKRREMLSARLGDVLSALFLVSAAVHRHVAGGEPRALEPLLDWACRELLACGEGALDEALRNWPGPGRPAAWLLRPLLFPLGRRHRPPPDRLTRVAAELVSRPGPARDALTDAIHRPSGAGEPLAELEEALRLAVAAEEAERALRRRVPRAVRAQGTAAVLAWARAHDALEPALLDAVEAAEAARMRVIQVDDFPPDLGLGGQEHERWPHGARAGRAAAPSSS